LADNLTDTINDLPGLIEFKRQLGQVVEIAVWMRATHKRNLRFGEPDFSRRLHRACSLSFVGSESLQNSLGGTPLAGHLNRGIDTIFQTVRVVKIQSCRGARAAPRRATIVTHVAAVKAAGVGIALCRTQVTVFQRRNAAKERRQQGGLSC
jgi:hypothetical protein